MKFVALQEDAQEDAESKWGYSGSYQPVPFPVHDWRVHKTVPGVDREYALKHGKRMKVALKDLNATQSRVRTIDTNHKTKEDMPPLIVRHQDKLWIQDGHHRLTQSYMNGHTHADAIVVDKDRSSC